MEPLGARIKQLRLTARLSKAALARRVGVSDVTVSYWESGAIRQIGHARLVALAEALSCPLSMLLEGKNGASLAVLTHTGPLPWEQHWVTPTHTDGIPLDVPWSGPAFMATPAADTCFAPLAQKDLALFGPAAAFRHAGHYLVRRDDRVDLAHYRQPPPTHTPLCALLLAHWQRAYSWE